MVFCISILNLYSGGVYGVPGFVGCMRLIGIDGNYRLPTDWKKDVVSTLLMSSLIQNIFICLELGLGYLM